MWLVQGEHGVSAPVERRVRVEGGVPPSRDTNGGEVILAGEDGRMVPGYATLWRVLHTACEL